MKPRSFVVTLVGIVTGITILSADALAHHTGGPDQSGYRWRRGPLTWGLMQAPIRLNLRDDQVSGALPLGFRFSFHGRTYENVYVSSNGFITFLPGQPSGCCSGHRSPRTTNPDAVIAGYWADLNPAQYGAIHYMSGYIGSQRVWIVEFGNVPHYGGSWPVTFQIILFSGSNDAHVWPLILWGPNRTHELGQENQRGDIGFSIRHGDFIEFFSNRFEIDSPPVQVNALGRWTVDEGSSRVITGGCAPSCAGGRTYGWTLRGDRIIEAYGTSALLTGLDGTASGNGLLFGYCTGGGCNQLTVWDRADWTVNNVAPTITTTPVTNLTLGQAWTYDANATDPAGARDPLTWSLQQGPTGMTIGSSDGVVRWTPSAPGLYPVRIRVNDGDGGIRDQSFTLDVGEQGGPDYAGYRWARDNSWAFTDISGTGTNVSLGDDAVSGALPIGFVFNFYGLQYSRAYISSNGYLMLTPGSNGCCSGAVQPSTGGANAVIAGYWEDLNPSAGGSIRYRTTGSAPNRRFTVQFTDVPHWPNRSSVTFQMILFEGKGDAEIRCLRCQSDGGTHAMGFENGRGDIGLSIRRGNFSMIQGRYRMIAPAVHVNIGGPYTVNEGAGLGLLGSCYNCTSYEWDYGGEGTYDATGRTPTYTGIDGTRTRNMVIRACRSGTCNRDRWTLRELNVPPEIDTSPPLTAIVGRQYAYNPSGHDDAGSLDNPLVWDFVTAPAGMSVNASNGRVRWTPAAVGTYNVTLRLRDDVNAAGLQRWTITVSVDVTGGGPYTVAEGGTVPLRASCAGCNAYSWDLDGNGSYETSGQNVTYSGRDGPATPTVRVRGCNGSYCDVDTPSVTVTNQPPSIDTTAPGRGEIGVEYEYDARASDPAGGLDTLSWTLTARPATNAPDNGLIGFWGFEDDVHDDSGRGNDGELRNGPQYDSDAPFGLRSMRFDGTNDHINLSPHVADYQGLSSGTITAWFKTSRTTGTGAILAASDRSDGSRELRLIVESNRLRYQVRGDSGSQSNLQSAAGVADDRWHHAAVTVSGGTARLYLDGVQVASGARPFFSAVNNIDSMSIARNVDSGGAQWYFPGRIDEVGIWSRALTTAEIAGLVAGTGSSGLTLTSLNTSGRVRWMPTEGGRWTVSMTVADEDGASDSQTWTIIVGVTGDPGGPYSVPEGGDVALRGTCNGCDRFAWDLDNNGSFETAGAVVTFDAAGLDGPSNPTVRLRVCEGSGVSNCAISSPSIAVTNVAPTITTSPSLIGALGQSYSYDANASDPAGAADPFVWTLRSNPAGLTINASTGVVSWPSGSVVAGRHTVEIQVADGDGGIDRQAWTIVVVEADAGGPYTVDEGSSITLDGSCEACTHFAWDLDGNGSFEQVGEDVSFSALDGDATPAVTLRACDRPGTANCHTASVQITIDNVAPSFTNSAPPTAVAGQRYDYDANASDPAGARDTLAFTLLTRPAGMTVNGGTGELTWPTPVGGAHAVSLRVADEDGGATLQNWTLRVVSADAQGPYRVDEFSSITLRATCSECSSYEWDLDGNGSFETNGNNVTFTAGDGGSTPTVTVRACRGAAFCHLDSPSLTVDNVAPTITSVAPTEAIVLSDYAYQAAATDPAGAADPLTWSLVSPPMGMTVTSNGGLVEWTPQIAGTYRITLQVSDGDGGIATQVWDLIVPVEVTTGGPYVTNEGSNIDLTASCTECTRFDWDLDDDGTFETAGRTVSFTTTGDGTAVFAIAVRACEDASNNNCDVGDSTVTVRNVAPTITSTAPTAGNVGVQYVYAPAATDPAGANDTLTWSLDVSPTGMQIVPTTGRITWTSAVGGTHRTMVRVSDEDGGFTTQTFDIVLPVLVDDGGPYVVDEGDTVTLTATCNGCTRFEWDLDDDGTFEAAGAAVDFDGLDGQSTPTVTVRVCEGAGLSNCAVSSPALTVFNVAPTITSAPSTSADVGDDYTYSPVAVDPAGALDTLTWALTTRPAGMTIDTSSGLIEWSPSIGGSYNVALRVSDEDGGSRLQSWTIVVSVIAYAGGPYVVDEGSGIDLIATCNGCSVFAWDLDNNGSYEVSTRTTRFNGIDGTVNPTVRLRVCEDATLANCDTDVPDLTVRNVAPTITSTAITAGTLGVRYRYQMSATDPAGANDPLTFALVTAPAGLTLDSSSGLMEWTPGVGGTHPILVRVTDGDGGVTTQSWNLVIPPGIAAGGPYNVDEGDDITLSGTCNGCTRFAWDLDDNGTYETAGASVTYRARDGDLSPVVTLQVCEGAGTANCSTASPSLTVNNLPPSITSLPSRSVALGDRWVYQATAVDPAGAFDPLLWLRVRGPGAMTVTATSGRFVWVATAGRHDVEIRVIDGDGGDDSQAFTLVVIGADIGGPYAANEYGTVQLAGACDNCSSMRWDLDADGDFDDAMGPVPVFDADGIDGLTTKAISLEACDNNGVCAVDSTTVQVANVAPSFTSAPPTKATAGTEYRYPATATDPAGTDDPLTFSLITGPSGMTVGASNGVITWTAAVGRHAVILEVADDDGGSVRQSWNIDVIAIDSQGPYAVDEGSSVVLEGSCVGCVNFGWDLDFDGTFERSGARTTFSAVSRDGDAVQDITFRACDSDGYCATDTSSISIDNVAPTFSTTPPATGVAGEPYRYNAAATDPAGAADPLTFSLVSGPMGLTVSSTGAVAWSAVPGLFSVTIRVSDGDGGITDQIWTIDVPSPVSIDAQGPYGVGEGDAVAVTAACSGCDTYGWDLDGDGDFDDGNAASAAFSAVGIDGPQAVTVAVEGCTGSGFCSRSSARVDVNNVDPTITSSPPTTGVAGQVYGYAPSAADPAGAADPLTWALILGPTGLNVAASSGVVAWPAVPGRHRVIIEVSDGDGGSATQSWDIDVLPTITVSQVIGYPQPERAEYTFTADAPVDWQIDLYPRDAMGCGSMLLARHTVIGQISVSSAFSGLSPGQSYCWVTAASAGGPTAQRNGDLSLDPLPTFTSGPSARNVVLDIAVSATVSETADGLTEFALGSCETMQTALAFDGSSVATFNGAVAPAAAFSIEAWINLDGVASQSRRLFGIGGGAVELALNNGALELTVVTTAFHRLTAPVAVPVSRWAHVVASFSADDVMRIWVDGLLHGQQPVAGGDLALATPQLTIGAVADLGFIGQVASAAVYDRPLDAGEIQDHYDDGAGVELAQEAGLVAAWDFDEADGVQSIYDVSGQHFAGVLGTDYTSGASDPDRSPSFASSVFMGSDAELFATLTGLAGGRTFCIRVVATMPTAVIASPPLEHERELDVTPPTVDANPLTVVDCVANESASVVLTAPTVVDNLDPAPLLVATVGGNTITFPYSFPLGETPVEWRATDTFGNVGTAIERVIVQDQDPPTVIGGSMLTFEATSPMGTPAAATPDSASDTCSVVAISHDGPPLFGLGVTPVRFTVSDTSGNEAFANRLVRIEDTIPPWFDPPLADLYVGHDGAACFSFTPATPTFRDNGYPANAITVSSVRISGGGRPSCWNLGDHEVEWTLEDPSGNVAVGVQTVHVVDATLDIDYRGIEVSGMTQPALRYYPTSVEVIFAVSSGTPPYQVSLSPAPAALTANGNVYRARYDGAGAYPQLLITARDEGGAGSNFGSQIVDGFGIDLDPPTIGAALADQSRVVLADQTTYPPVFVGERLDVQRVLAADGVTGLAMLEAGLEFEGAQLATISEPAGGFWSSAPSALGVQAWLRVRGFADGSLVRLGTSFELSTTADGRVRLVASLDGFNREVVGGDLQRDRWHHVAATYDGRALRLWLDGQPAASAATSGIIDIGPGNLEIGAGFVGAIAEVAVAAAATSQDEVRRNFAGGVGRPIVSGASTVGLYRLDGTDQLVADGSGRGHHGALGRTTNVEPTDPRRLDLRPVNDPTSSGLVEVTVELIDADDQRTVELIRTGDPAAGAPLPVGARGIGGSPCTAPVGSVCGIGEVLLRPSSIVDWATGFSGHHLRLRATDAAGHVTEEIIAFRTSGYIEELDVVLDRVTDMLADPQYSIASNELEDAERAFLVAHSYATMAQQYLDGSYLMADHGLIFLLDAADVGIDLGELPDLLGRALSGDVRRYLDNLGATSHPNDAAMIETAERYLLDGRFTTAERVPDMTIALARSAMDSVALLYPPYQPVRSQLRSLRARWQAMIDEVNAGNISVDDLRVDTLRAIFSERLVVGSRDLIRDVLHVEVSAAMTNPLTTERDSLTAFLDVILKESNLADEEGDLVAASVTVFPGCLDLLSSFSLDDRTFTLCYLRLNDTARVLDQVSEPLVHTYRWRAGLALILFDMLELSMYMSPFGLPWVASNVPPPDVELVLPDALAATVLGAIGASTVDFPDGALVRSYERHGAASGYLDAGAVDDAWAIFVEERCLLLTIFNRYYSVNRTIANVGDPKEATVDPLSVGCSGGQ